MSDRWRRLAVRGAGVAAGVSLTAFLFAGDDSVKQVSNSFRFDGNTVTTITRMIRATLMKLGSTYFVIGEWYVYGWICKYLLFY